MLNEYILRGKVWQVLWIAPQQLLPSPLPWWRALPPMKELGNVRSSLSQTALQLQVAMWPMMASKGRREPQVLSTNSVPRPLPGTLSVWKLFSKSAVSNTRFPGNSTPRNWGYIWLHTLHPSTAQPQMKNASISSPPLWVHIRTSDVWRARAWIYQLEFLFSEFWMEVKRL